MLFGFSSESVQMNIEILMIATRILLLIVLLFGAAVGEICTVFRNVEMYKTLSSGFLKTVEKANIKFVK
ncbi:Perilipin-2 [Dirofilaria immitis]